MIPPAPLLPGKLLHAGQFWIAMDTARSPLGGPPGRNCQPHHPWVAAAAGPTRSKGRRSSCTA